MTNHFKPRPLLLEHIRSKLAELEDPSADDQLVSVDIAEIFYDFWKGEGLLRVFLEAQGREQVMNVLVDLQLLFEHLQGHIAKAVKGVNGITKMVPQA